MPKFFYAARTKAGKKDTGVMEAANQDDVVSRLQAKDLVVIGVFSETKQGEAITSPGAETGLRHMRKHNRISLDDMTLFCRQLATLLGAGVTILRCLQIIEQQIGSRRLLAVIKGLEKNMEGGLSLHEAMKKYPKVFSELWINLVESGEASGSLALVLNRLATYMERNSAFRKKLVSALIYPAILFFAGLGALLFLTLKIIPTFAELFKGFKVDLPPLTQLLVNVSGFIRSYALLILVVGTISFWLLRRYIRTKPGRLQYEKTLFSLPGSGEFLRVYCIERFTSEMATLVESGVPILYALEITQHSVGNLVLGNIISQVKEEVRGGKSLSAPMEKSGFFDPMAVQMVAIGEEIGDLPGMFKRLNSFYQEQIETFLVRFTAAFEPMMLVFMGGVIGLMVIGMFLPIFKIASLGGGQ